MKKLLISIGALGTIIAPVVSVVSCNQKNNLASEITKSTRTDEEIIATLAKDLKEGCSKSIMGGAAGILSTSAAYGTIPKDKPAEVEKFIKDY